jgi:oligosaccharide:H+ symporter
VHASGLFLVYVYGPLLKTNILAGAALGGIYLGVTFMAGSYAIESYVDRIGRKPTASSTAACDCGARWASPAPPSDRAPV